MTSHESYELSYATPNDPPLKRWLMRSVENLSGRRRLLPLYHRWQRESAGKSPHMWSDALDLIGTKVELEAPPDWHTRIPAGPLVIIANHPFGIADGIAMLALAERIARPYRILLYADFMRIPEMQPLGLPIDFSETKKAIANNLKTRAEARRLLKEGVTIVIFPAGGVATAETPFGTAEELPWKQFVVRLIQQSGATVLPVYFEGQNSPLFHLISRFSLTLRLSLLVSEFRHKIGSTIRVRVGIPVAYADIVAGAGAGPFIDELYVRVQRLAPGMQNAERDQLLPRSLQDRHRFPWDVPFEGGLGGSKRRTSNGPEISSP